VNKRYNILLIFGGTSLGQSESVIFSEGNYSIVGLCH